MPWVEISEAAFTLGVSERTIRNWIKSGKLQARNMNGRREVEIPDAEAGQSAHAFSDDDAEPGQPIEVQKRLEVALIECGRVKGTLASQERMMESLSANIAELNAKLQRSERVIGRRTVYCVVVGFLGVVAYLVCNASYSKQENEMMKRHEEEKNSMTVRYTGEKAELQVKHKDEIKDTMTREAEKRTRELGEQAQRMRQEAKNEMDELREDLFGRLREVEEKNMRLSNELATEKDARLKLETELASLQKDLENAEARRAEIEKIVEVQKSRLEELDRDKRDLEQQLSGQQSSGRSRR